MKTLLQKLIWVYQATLSGIIGPRCRFYPSCSHYAVEALEQHGVVKGTVLSVTRIARCHPFHEGGYDPVPAGQEKISKQTSLKPHFDQLEVSPDSGQKHKHQELQSCR